MLIVLSPAKSLDFETPSIAKISTTPAFASEALSLVKLARKLSCSQIAELMDISPSLAQLNADRFFAWSESPDKDKIKQAVLAFNGDVYDGLDAKNLNAKQFDYLQKHLNILSGLYGLLRPLDLIQAYRLEMGSRMANSFGHNLYSFWGAKITDALNERAQNQNSKVLVNLASEEYFKSITPKNLTVPVITPVFQDFKNGKYKIISFYAKKARGLMVRYCAEHKIEQVEKLKSFKTDGYAFCEEESDQQRWVFRRALAE